MLFFNREPLNQGGVSPPTPPSTHCGLFQIEAAAAAPRQALPGAHTAGQPLGGVSRFGMAPGGGSRFGSGAGHVAEALPGLHSASRSEKKGGVRR